MSTTRRKERKEQRRKHPDRRVRKEAKRVLNAQRKAAAIREKYGPSRRPSPVTVRSMETGEVLTVEDQRKFRPRPNSPWLNNQALAAGYGSYAEYIASPYWLKLRQRVLDRDKRRCVLCGSAENLAVHHDRYNHLGAERLQVLKAFCHRCHRRIHA